MIVKNQNKMSFLVFQTILLNSLIIILQIIIIFFNIMKNMNPLKTLMYKTPICLKTSNSVVLITQLTTVKYFEIYIYNS